MMSKPRRSGGFYGLLDDDRGRMTPGLGDVEMSFTRLYLLVEEVAVLDVLRKLWVWNPMMHPWDWYIFLRLTEKVNQM